MAFFLLNNFPQQALRGMDLKMKLTLFAWAIVALWVIVPVFTQVNILYELSRTNSFQPQLYKQLLKSRLQMFAKQVSHLVLVSINQNAI